MNDLTNVYDVSFEIDHDISIMPVLDLQQKGED